MKQFACWFTHGVGNGSELRRIVHAAQTPGEVLDSVERFFAASRPASAVNEDSSPWSQLSSSSSKQRSERRIAVRLPLKVSGRDPRGVLFEEETSSENVCRNGAAFVTRSRSCPSAATSKSASPFLNPSPAAPKPISPPAAASSTSPKATPRTSASSASSSPAPASAASSAPNPPLSSFPFRSLAAR